MTDILDSTVADLRAALDRGAISAEDLIAASLARAGDVQARLNAFTAIDAEGALAAAREADRRRADGHAPRPLEGIPMVVKDMTPTAGLPTTLGSWTTGDGETAEDALIVARLRAAGAILVAKSTTPEFAHSGFTASPRYGITRNPWDPSRTPGGSSGGSGVAVATRVAPIAEGTDMGGSVRIPAGACGCVGLKPSLGRIPMTILPTPIDTMSHFGPLAATVADATAFLAATAGPSDLDLLSQTRPFDPAACAPVSLRGLRLAFSLDLGYCAVSPEVADRLHAALGTLRAAGATVTETPIRWTREVADAWADKWAALLALFPTGHGAENRARMDPGLLRYLDRAEAITALDLKRTELVQSRMAADMAAIMADHDALLCPTNAISPPPVTETDAAYEGDTPEGLMRTFDMTHPFSMLAPYPAISLPAGFTPDGLPVGLQVVGPRFADERLLAIAGGIEAALGPGPAAPLA